MSCTLHNSLRHALFITGEDLDLLAILSGVSIIETIPDLSLVFGCYPQKTGTGGVGLLKTSNRWKHKTLHPLMDGGRKLRSGSITVIDDLPKSCTSIHLSKAVTDREGGGRGRLYQYLSQKLPPIRGDTSAFLKIHHFAWESVNHITLILHTPW